VPVGKNPGNGDEESSLRLAISRACRELDYCGPSRGGALRAAFLCNPAPQLLPAETQQALPGDIQTHTHWLLGAGLDKALALKSTLLLADVFAEKFEGIGRKTDVTAELGVRHQWRPQAVFSAGLGRHFRGAGFSTFLNLGVTLSHAFQL